MTHKKIDKVIIIGSGVSRSLAGVPIQNDFWKSIQEHIKQKGMHLYHEQLLDQLQHAVKLDRLGEGFNLEELNDIQKRFSWLH